MQGLHGLKLELPKSNIRLSLLNRLEKFHPYLLKLLVVSRIMNEQDVDEGNVEQ